MPSRSRRPALAVLACLLAGCGPCARPRAATTPAAAIGASARPEAAASPFVRKGDKASRPCDYLAALGFYEQARGAGPPGRRVLWRLVLICQQLATELPPPRCSPWYLRSA